jgi:hypothetical protein
VAINFPTSLDNFTNPSSGNTLDSPSHSLQHSDINDAVEAMQRKVGVGTAVAGSASAGQVLTISAAGTSTWSTPTPGGLVLLTTATFSGVTSVSAPNNIFTSTYANYRIVLDLTSVAADADMAIRLRASGSDNVTSNYATSVAYFTTTNTLSGYSANSGQTAWQIFPTDAGTNNHSYSVSIDLYRPQEAQLTTATLLANGITFTGTIASFFGGNLFNATTQFDSLSFLNAGNIAGRYSIYGYSL